MPLVGVLLSEDRSRHLPEFSRALADLGWIDGKTVRLEVRAAEGRHDQMPRLAIELVRRKVDVIAALLGTPPALAAKQATATIPIVFTTAGDPVAFGIVSNVARPERNLTGVGGTVSLNYKRLQLLKEAVPDAKRVGFLTNVENPIHRTLIGAAERAARQLGLELYESECTRVSTAWARPSQRCVGNRWTPSWSRATRSSPARPDVSPVSLRTHACRPSTRTAGSPIMVA